tara:strand:+ start:3893 stop:4525 length:633 start_codon:yes stop_codon:yes gene_type:complete
MRQMIAVLSWMIGLGCTTNLAAQQVPQAWVLALGWTPQFCKRHSGSWEPQCLDTHYWAVHGLRPDFSGAEPTQCEQGVDVTDEKLGQLMHVLPNRVTLKKIWQEHGACSGMDFEEYFLQMDRAGRRVTIPARFAEVLESITLPKSEVRQAFMEANPGMTRDAIRLACHRSDLEEVRICLDQDFRYRSCGIYVEEDCGNKIRLRYFRGRRR